MTDLIPTALIEPRPASLYRFRTTARDSAASFGSSHGPSGLCYIYKLRFHI